jgi:hypothetical protein
MRAPSSSNVRFRIDPADIPPEKAARRLHISLDRFNEVLPRLLARGFPAPDQDTGNFGLEAIDQWRKMRNPALFGLTEDSRAAQDATLRGAAVSMGDRFIEAKKRGRHRGST